MSQPDSDQQALSPDATTAEASDYGVGEFGVREPGLRERGVYIKTFGCQMNEYDTEKMFHLLSAEYDPVSEPEKASVIILNTCSVREKAEHKLFSLLGEMRELKKERADLIIGVSGCVAQQEGSKILSRVEAVDFVVGTHNLSLIPSLVARAKAGERSAAIDYREEWEELPSEFDSLPRMREDGDIQKLRGYLTPVRALVAIQRGCNKRCSFCVVPTTRGKEVSRDPQEILREIRLKARAGAREVMLLGQTVNSYGRDLSPRFGFHTLVRQIAEIEGITRIRFTSPHPVEVRPEFIELYGDVPQLMPHIHLPLQSGNDRVLREMNRNYKVRRYLDIVDAVRTRLPSVAITTDIIVGFPTESAAEFEDTLRLVEQVRYHAAYYFKYSRRPNTVAVNEYPKDADIAASEVSERFQRLDALQTQISSEINSSLTGEIVEVLIEGANLGQLSSKKGRIPQNTLVELSCPDDLVGETVHAKVVHTSPRGVRAELLSTDG
ncbi:MAG: tRNA (N6-isopentenyl adenosine(37)-C2)-methylthiotransferase MiaB [Deltaproteobacteria bacterium]|nr:tRNA (N6-isopentenyl adenosine(37)-C2)-methylthiotransferase MiaB [Deltaproteobacteria bacterium]